MFIFITIGILVFIAMILLVLRFALPDFRFAWLTATGGALLAWISVFIWQAGMPIIVQLPVWKPENIFRQSRISWSNELSRVTGKNSCSARA